MSSLLVSDIIKMGEVQLKAAGVENTRGDAESLYCFLKKVPRSKFFLEWSSLADDRTCEQFFDLIARRCRREPLQHITGSQEFMGLKFHVAREVLIPRLDTETLAMTAELLIKKNSGKTVLDLCCGSGAVGIALAKRAGAKVTAVDISQDAVSLTAENAKLNDVKVEVRQGDLFEAVKRKKYHYIVSNPPYIRRDVLGKLMPEVRDFEPATALDGGVDGLDFYRRIVEEAPSHLKKKGMLIFEIGHDQAKAVMDLMLERENFEDIQVMDDMAGRNRVVSGLLAGRKK